MKKTILIVMFIVILFSVNGLLAFEPHFIDYPTLSSDGENVAFVFNNDIWRVSVKGGVAKRLTDSESRESHPKFSPDDNTLAFNSDREGWLGLYLMPADGGEAQLVSREKFTLIDWFSDGKYLLTRRYEPGYGYKFYKINMQGEYEIFAEFAGPYADLSADDNQVIFNRRGYTTRESYTGSVDGEIWIYDKKDDSYTDLTDNELTETYPVFGKNRNLYMAASDGKIFQLASLNLDDPNQKKNLTNHKTWSVKDVDIAREHDVLVYTLFDQLWIYDIENDNNYQMTIEIKEDWSDEGYVKENVHNKFNNFAISEDDKLLAFSYKYDLFAMPLKGGDVKQLTFDQAGVEKILIASDNKTIFFTKFVKGIPQLFCLNILEPENIKQVNSLKNNYIESIYEQDGHILIHYQDDQWNRFVAVGDSLFENVKNLNEERVIFNMCQIQGDDLFFINVRQPGWLNQIFHYDLETGKETRILNHPGGINSLFLGKDNNSLFYVRGGDIYRLDLSAKDDFYDEEDHWKDIINEDVKDKNEDKDKKEEISTPSELVVDFENIAQRQHPIIQKTGYNWIIAVKDDSTFYYINSMERKNTLRQSNYKGENDKSLKTFRDMPENFYYDEDKDIFYYSENNVMQKLVPKSGKTSMLKNEFKYEYNRFELNKTVFERVWTEFEHGFYDEDMHGIDWDESYKRFSKYLKYANNTNTLGKIVDEMIGEVDASHTGFYPRNESKFITYDQAYLGAEIDFKKGPAKEPIITKIYRNSKLNKPYEIPQGSKIISIDDKKIASENEILPLFMDKVRDKITLEIETPDSVVTVTLKGLSYWQNENMRYDNWVQERAKMVEDFSDGRIGYLHIRSMNNRSYDQFVEDLFAENIDKEALIIDVRNNGGGYIHDRLLEDLTRESYGYTTNRAFNENPEKTPSRIWEKPLVLLINENSFSDAEIFPNIFKFKKLGKVIGMPTSGSVIGTGHINFMDGSSMRMPGSGWYLADGTNMEGNGAQPDIFVKPTPKQIITDDDIQLKTAVEELLKDL